MKSVQDLVARISDSTKLQVSRNSTGHFFTNSFDPNLSNILDIFPTDLSTISRAFITKMEFAAHASLMGYSASLRTKHRTTLGTTSKPETSQQLHPYRRIVNRFLLKKKKNYAPHSGNGKLRTPPNNHRSDPTSARVNLPPMNDSLGSAREFPSITIGQYIRNSLARKCQTAAAAAAAAELKDATLDRRGRAELAAVVSVCAVLLENARDNTFPAGV